MSRLGDKVAIVTGASSGIGEATALALGQDGVKVVCAARRKDRLDDLVQAIVGEGGHAVAVECDVRDRAQVEHVVKTAMDDFNRVDVLINNAGVMANAPIVNCRMDDWDRMVDVNVKGLLYGIGLVLPIMLEQKSGHIVNVSSIAGRRVFPNGAVYCGTKHAVHAISEGLRNELSTAAQENDNRIRVTVISPGVVQTELPDSITDTSTRSMTSEYYDSMPGALQSEDIAEAIMYALRQPEHVDVNEICVRPTAQVG